ncbi:MAG: preprotein translocase subunit YajC, partial [Elusimicrobia bacterium]|nr:preprotein translocase subunit YajC [Elusimicrobiota bacterium]MBD3412170.1 preprotein translocase subunit YajC [Elusimicrobiota bacterium]
MIGILYAAAPEAGSSAQPVGGPQGGLMNLFPLIVIFGIFYFLLIRPQQKRAKEHQNMINQLNRGDRVVTSGGIYGVITALRGKVIELKIADNVKIQVLKSSISGKVSEDGTGSDTANVTEAEV